MSSTKERRILDEVRDIMRLHHYSIHTERSYCQWIKRFIQFHKMQSRHDLKNGELKIEQFLTHLAVNETVSPSTQNQAMNALVFLYRKVLKHDLARKIDAVRVQSRETVPVVMTRWEYSSSRGKAANFDADPGDWIDPGGRPAWSPRCVRGGVSVLFQTLLSRDFLLGPKKPRILSSQEPSVPSAANRSSCDRRLPGLLLDHLFGLAGPP